MAHHYAYAKPHNSWGKGARQTVQLAFQWARKREPRPRHSDSVKTLRYERAVWLVGRMPNRLAVGTIRVLGAPKFFNGCYLGAEND